jgi:hypothetical protein
MIPPVPCTVCKEGGHRSRDCPALTAPLRGGFSYENGTSGVDPDGGEEERVTVPSVSTNSALESSTPWQN